MRPWTGRPTSPMLAEQAAPLASTVVVRDCMQLAKPRLTFMVVVTAMIGFGLGMTGAMDGQAWLALAATALGSTLCCVGAGTLNQVYERSTDALMLRTAERPLAAGRMTPRWGVGFGAACCLLGVAVLGLLANPLAAVVAVTTIVSYAAIYTPMKRVSSTATIIGAFPGALPPVIGYAAAANRIGVEAVLLFAIMFLWQLPHFLAIAWLYRDDFARAAIPVLPVVDPTGRSTFRQLLLGCVVLLPLGLMPTAYGICGLVYFTGALLAGLMFLAFGAALALNPTRARARAAFFASLVYLPVVLILMLIDRV